MKGVLLKISLLLLLMALPIGALVAHEDTPPGTPEGDGHVHPEDHSFDEPLTYYADIQPIMEAHCMACHAEGQIAGEYELYDPLVIQENAEYLADMANHRDMPPWMPNPNGTVPLMNPRILTDEEIATLMHWAETGAELGDPTQAVTINAPVMLPQVRRDIEFFPEVPYQPQEGVNDDYRCFVYDPGFTEPTYVTDYVFEPNHMEMAHHAIIFIEEAQYRETAEAMSGVDGQPGWTCYGMAGVSGEGLGGNMLGGWTPGMFSAGIPDGMGYLMQPGDFFVLQMHLNTRTVSLPDASGFAIETAGMDEGIIEVKTRTLAAPVEIACPDGNEGEHCDRDYAIAYNSERYDTPESRPNLILAACRKSLADYAEQDPANTTSSCDFPVRREVTAYGVFGHMHELGTSISIELNPGAEDSQMLLDIPEWDFHWQDRYQFAEPVTLHRGDSIRITCTWDNTLAENPRYVVWGSGTEDEMCFGTLMIVAP